MSLINNIVENKNIHRFSHQAMNTIFEIVIDEVDKEYAEQAASAAFEEINRLEKELSRFLPNSDVSRINSLNVGEEICLSPDIFECLKISKNIYNSTNGLFDVTSGKIIDRWKVSNTKIRIDPTSFDIGFNNIILDETNYTISKKSKSTKIDLGGIGKGYAIDCVIGLITEWDINNSIIHSGSTVKAIGKLSGYNGWPISISNPSNTKQTIMEIILKDSSLSGSGTHKGGHIINPITTLPVKERIGAWAMAESAAQSDAMSTTFMIMNTEEIIDFCKINTFISGLIILNDSKKVSEQDIILTNNFKDHNLLI